MATMIALKAHDAAIPRRLARPPKPPFVPLRMPERRWFAPLRALAKRQLLGVIDRGWFGATPLRTHVVMCGFPRSGTTLLQLMMETAYPNARTFHRERAALAAVQNTWPGRHELMITKRPDDLFWLDEVRERYRDRRPRPLFIISVRDPRAVLTSVHAKKSGYCVPPEKWRAAYEHIQYNLQFDDVITVEYREVIEQPQQVQERLSSFIGSSPKASFDEYLSSVPSDFDTTALNGVRPLDASGLDRWRAPKHADRIRQLLRELPELPDRLIEMGYEADTAWTRHYV
jgi:hypothetical protein